MIVLLISRSCSSLTFTDISPLCMVTTCSWSRSEKNCSLDLWLSCTRGRLLAITTGFMSSRHSLCNSDRSVDNGWWCWILLVGGLGGDWGGGGGWSLPSWLFCLLCVLDKIFCILLLNCLLPWAWRSLTRFCWISWESGGIGLEIETLVPEVLSVISVPGPVLSSSCPALPGDVADTVHLCVLCVTLYRNLRPHVSHVYGRTPVWILRWTRYDTRWRKLFPHVSQTNGLSPLWIRSWFCSVDNSLKARPQMLQQWGFSSVW